MTRLVLRHSRNRVSFFWWDDAIAAAVIKARLTGRRQQVRRGWGRRWFVSEVGV